MEFVNKLIETEDSKRASEMTNPISLGLGGGFRMLQGIKLGNGVHLSVQASSNHYCSPRKTIDLTDYDEMELAVFKDNQFASVTDVIDNNPLAQKFEEHYEGTVYGFVPVELIEELYQELSE
ncbi:hypothetical protein [Halobacillus litoralis]|uniref:hypothetical protein n=1 Tax=Halobacillus litoralis TaxID=45668 RepID=UPI001CD1C0A9|nr:hypothetical protein [Halobacillus litoralis]MCA1021586.1 hypothetical protein [Halobacillus litoralis]